MCPLRCDPNCSVPSARGLWQQRCSGAACNPMCPAAPCCAMLRLATLMQVWVVQEFCELGDLGECLQKRLLVRRPDGSHRTVSVYRAGRGGGGWSKVGREKVAVPPSAVDPPPRPGHSLPAAPLHVHPRVGCWAPGLQLAVCWADGSY